MHRHINTPLITAPLQNSALESLNVPLSSELIAGVNSRVSGQPRAKVSADQLNAEFVNIAKTVAGNVVGQLSLSDKWRLVPKAMRNTPEIAKGSAEMQLVPAIAMLAPAVLLDLATPGAPGVNLARQLAQMSIPAKVDAIFAAKTKSAHNQKRRQQLTTALQNRKHLVCEDSLTERCAFHGFHKRLAKSIAYSCQLNEGRRDAVVRALASGAEQSPRAVKNSAAYLALSAIKDDRQLAETIVSLRFGPRTGCPLRADRLKFVQHKIHMELKAATSQEEREKVLERYCKQILGKSKNDPGASLSLAKILIQSSLLPGCFVTRLGEAVSNIQGMGEALHYLAVDVVYKQIKNAVTACARAVQSLYNPPKAEPASVKAAARIEIGVARKNSLVSPPTNVVPVERPATEIIVSSLSFRDFRAFESETLGKQKAGEQLLKCLVELASMRAQEKKAHAREERQDLEVEGKRKRRDAVNLCLRLVDPTRFSAIIEHLLQDDLIHGLHRLPNAGEIMELARIQSGRLAA